MKKDIIFSVGGKNYKLKEVGNPSPGPGDRYDPDDIGLPQEPWTPERVEEALRPAIDALKAMHQTQDLNYMVYSELIEAVRILETIIKKCPKKKFD
jgi:hypothetical protein